MVRSEALVKAQKKYFEKKKLDPEFVEDRRTRSMDYYEKHKEDETYKQKQRDRSMKYYYKNRDRLCAERREKYRIKKLDIDNDEQTKTIDSDSDIQ